MQKTLRDAVERSANPDQFLGVNENQMGKTSEFTESSKLIESQRINVGSFIAIWCCRWANQFTF